MMSSLTTTSLASSMATRLPWATCCALTSQSSTTPSHSFDSCKKTRCRAKTANTQHQQHIKRHSLHRTGRKTSVHSSQKPRQYAIQRSSLAPSALAARRRASRMPNLSE